jgi:hypothetical protein
VKLPAKVGANPAVKLVLCPAAKVMGTLSPLRLNPVPLATACEIVTLEPPEFVSVTEADWLFPSRTLPNPMLDGFADNWPGARAVPERGTTRVGLEALLLKVTWPVNVPAAAGLNFTLNETLCAGARVAGSVKPVILKPVPVTVACVIVSPDPPMFVKVSESV